MKGFVSFAVILAILAALLFFKIGTMDVENKLNIVENELIKAEISNKERTILENNVDKIVEIKLNEQIFKNNFDVIKAQDEINTTLSKYLLNKTYGATLAGEKISEATKLFLNQNSKVTILKTRYFTYAEYTFCSNALKNTTIKKALGNNIKSEFTIPIGYSKKIITPIYKNLQIKLKT